MLTININLANENGTDYEYYQTYTLGADRDLRTIDCKSYYYIEDCIFLFRMSRFFLSIDTVPISYNDDELYMPVNPGTTLAINNKDATICLTVGKDLQSVIVSYTTSDGAAGSYNCNLMGEVDAGGSYKIKLFTFLYAIPKIRDLINEYDKLVILEIPSGKIMCTKSTKDNIIQYIRDAYDCDVDDTTTFLMNNIDRMINAFIHCGYCIIYDDAYTSNESLAEGECIPKDKLADYVNEEMEGMTEFEMNVQLLKDILEDCEFEDDHWGIIYANSDPINDKERSISASFTPLSEFNDEDKDFFYDLVSNLANGMGGIYIIDRDNLNKMTNSDLNSIVKDILTSKMPDDIKDSEDLIASAISDKIKELIDDIIKKPSDDNPDMRCSDILDKSGIIKISFDKDSGDLSIDGYSSSEDNTSGA